MSADLKLGRLQSTDYDHLGYATMSCACYLIPEDLDSSLLQYPENSGTYIYRVTLKEIDTFNVM